MKKLTIVEIQNLQLGLIKKLHPFFVENGIPYYLIAGSALGAVRHNGFIPWDDDIDIGLYRKDYERFLKICNSFSNEYSIENFTNSKNCDYVLTRIFFPNTKIDNSQINNTSLNQQLYLDIFPLDNVPENEAERAEFERKVVKRKMLIARIDVRDNGNPFPVIVMKKIVSLLLKPFRQAILGKMDRLMKKYQNDDTSIVCSLCSQYSFAKQVMPKSFYGTPVLHDFEDIQLYIPEKANDYLTTLYGKNYMEVPPENKRRKEPTVYIY